MVPGSVGAGDVVTLSGDGFAGSESITSSFPGYAPTNQTADPNGSFSAQLTVPNEPAGTHVVTSSAPSGIATDTFDVEQRLTLPASVGPTDTVPVSVTGFGSAESVNVAMDTGPTLTTLLTDPMGAASGSITVDTTFGTHNVTAMGAASGATKTMTLPVPATIDLSPTEGLVGTVVSITSASGWVPGESVQLFLGTSQLPDIVADSSGSVAGTLTIPQRQPGDVLVKLADQVLAVSAQMNFDVLDATCSPAFVPADAPYLMTRMADCPDGTTYTFAAGLYRVPSQLNVGEGDTLVGAGSGPGGTEFRGSISLPTSSFTPSGSLWVHAGDADQVGIMGDPCAPTVQGCGYRDWIYRDGEFLSRVLAPCTSLGPDQFCIDYNSDSIYLGSDPTGRVIEYGTVGQFLSGAQSGHVTIRDMSAFGA